jgi:Mrp family chromosome partitioning ATPase/capsular polysaccharide biosynthesis protein
MTFTQYVAVVLKRWPLVAICCIFIGAGAFIAGRQMKPLYQSSALVLVSIQTSGNQPNYDSVLGSQQLVQTEATLATSSPVLSVVASHYTRISLEQLSAEVSSSPQTGSQLFAIDVLDPNPATAATLANDIAATLIKQQQQAIAQNNLQAQKQMQQTLNQTSNQINTISAKIGALQAPGSDQQQLAVLQAQLAGLQQQYNQWQAALIQLELTQAQTTPLLSIAQSAQPATSPSQPNKTLITGSGLVVGLLLGLVLTIIAELLDTRVRTPEVLAELLHWPVLATVWRTNTLKREKVINPTGRNANSEAFRILRTNIGFAGVAKPLRTLIVTSSLPEEGKSSVAANLAIFMARAGKNTLLIDADLRSPIQHRAFSLAPNAPGLSNILLKFSTLQSGLKPFSQSLSTPLEQNEPSLPSLEPFVHTVGIPNLWVMPAGPLPPNPPELFESRAMQRFFTALEKSSVEVIIIDTAPVLGLADTHILAAKVDGVLVVTDMTRITKSKLKQVKAVLEHTGTRVLGTVANKQRRNRVNAISAYYSDDTQYNSDMQYNSGQQKNSAQPQVTLPPPVFNARTLSPTPAVSSSEFPTGTLPQEQQMKTQEINPMKGADSENMQHKLHEQA